MADTDTQDSPETPHETRDMPAPLPVGIILGVTLLVPLCVVLLWLLFQTLWRYSPAPSSAFHDISQREATAPPLLPNPAFHVPAPIRRMEERLQSIGWIDREAGIVHIPIEQAMGRLIERGTPEDVFSLKPGKGAKP